MSDKDAPSRRDVFEAACSEDAEPANEQTTARRPFLLGGLGTVGSVLGVGQNPTMSNDEVKEKVRKVMERYDTPGKAQRVLNEHASAISARVQKQGSPAAPAVDNPAVDDLRVGDGPAESDPEQATYLTALKRNGSFTAHLSFVRKSRGRTLRLIVQPEARRAYGLLFKRDGSLQTIIDPNRPGDGANQQDVTTQECTFEGYECPPNCCAYPFDCYRSVKYKRYCCRGVTDGCYEESTDNCCRPELCC